MHRLAPALATICLTLTIAACGDQQTETVTKATTVTKTVTVEAAPVSTEDERTAYCQSEKGDLVTQAGSEHQEAFNDADPAAARRAERKAMRAARTAPAGAECAVTALDGIRFNYNNGAGNLSGMDYRARAKAVRKFQAAHDLEEPVF